MPKILSLSIPEYSLETQPDYELIGSKIDNVVENNFEGEYLVRALSIQDHPNHTLDELVNIIVETGTDKYDPNRKGVAHEEFEPYRPDLQAGLIKVKDGKLQESFSGDIKLFYENTLIDRGYRLRIDLLVFYNPELMIRADKMDDTKPRVDPRLEEYLWRFKNHEEKKRAVVGIVKILK